MLYISKALHSLTKALLRLLYKFIEFEKQLHHYDITFTKDYYKRVVTIQKVYEQQLSHFETGERIKDRIVSIGKSYVRPIKRGKEVKTVEFGSKVHKLQIDGINFIEHLSFDNFNEGTRLQSTIYTAQRLTHKKTKLVGTDAIYATNKNGNFVSKHKKRQATYITLLQPNTLAAFPPWGIQRELVV